MAAVTRRLEGGVLRLELSNPDQANALTPAMLVELTDALLSASDDPEVRVVVLRGAGNVFSSGYSFSSFPEPDDLHDEDELTRAGDALATCSKPTIAVLTGDAIGAAFDLALAADFRLATDGARVGITPARFGIVYHWQGIARLVETLGPALARRLLLTAELLDAATAQRKGVLDEVASGDDQLAEMEERWLKRLLRAAPLSISGTKTVMEIVRRSASPSAAERDQIMDLRRAALSSDDAREALVAFRAKRPPVFTGK